MKRYSPESYDSTDINGVPVRVEPVTFERSQTTITQTFTISTNHDGIVEELTRRMESPSDCGANLVKTSVRTVSIKSTVITNR